MKLVHLELNEPVPANPVMADFLSGPKDFVSNRIADIIREFNPKGVGFIPTKLVDQKGNLTENYTLVLVDGNTFEALDKEKSVFEKKRLTYTIKKLVLDRKALMEIPEERRLAFRLREAPGYYLYHKSIVDAIMAANPAGVYFQNIESFSF